MKTDIDTLKSNIAEANIEYQELKAENQAIKDIAEQRDINIKKLKHEVGDSLEQNDLLNQQRRTLESEVSICELSNGLIFLVVELKGRKEKT